MAITTIKIFPPIGVARLGNSPSGFFVGPEIPGVRMLPPGGYKDAACRIKRQAARFRLYAYDETGTLVKEITAADGDISWTVELANTKASFREFAGLSEAGALRNNLVMNRSLLEIKPGPRTLNGPNQAAGFNTGTFLGVPVPLGEMRTESDGRLLVLGGFGRSAAPGAATPVIDHYANNDGWHDDVSDGPVNATVVIGGTTYNAVPAWVLCVPPDFAPPIDSVTTLYDTLLQTAADKLSHVTWPFLDEPASPSLTNDIYPILKRVFDLQRAVSLAGAGHVDFNNVAAMSASRRQDIFNRIRNPFAPAGPGSANMPKLFDDSNGPLHVITKRQYNILKKWSLGTFTDDWPGAPPPPPGTVTPEGLARAALEACVGAAMYPGIEASWLLRDKYTFAEPFRLDPTGRGAGDVTRQMAVPWQADFYECRQFGGLGWWPAQRPDDVFPDSGGPAVQWVRGLVASKLDMANNWQKLGFVVDKGGQLVETERIVTCTNLFLITDRSHFSEDEVQGALTGGVPAKFDAALYVVAEGFLPADLGITTGTPTLAQIQTWAPTITIKRADTSAVPGMRAVATGLLFQDKSIPAGLRQRFTFEYRIEFDNADGFLVGGMPAETQTATATATKGTYSSAGTLVLFHKANPYMLDGSTSWLSTDVRVFQITQGASRFGRMMGADPIAFVRGVVTDFNALPPAGHPYDTISEDQAAGRLELSRSVAGKRVYNYAIARVRYRAKALTATDVRVFFRLFTTAATGLDYDQNSTYRRSPLAVPVALLGLQGNKPVTIPFFATERVDSSVKELWKQEDEFNKQTLAPAAGAETYAYFGCWLDFNQTTPYFPNDALPADGPWGSGRKSIQELIRGMHQCLVAEVYFNDDPTPFGATPAANDNLAQRNLVISESDNPGSPATHTVQHTFEIKATNPPAQIRVREAATGLATAVASGAAGAGAVVGSGASDGVADAGTTGAGATTAPPSISYVEVGPDELMFRWNDLPRESDVTIYMPDVEADDVIGLADASQESSRLERVDAHTIRCLPADVHYLPLPKGRSRNIAALLTIGLPEKVQRGQLFRPTVHQISGRPRRIIGAFELAIPVRVKAELLEPEIRKLSVLRHIYGAIPVEDAWRAVFKRYIGQIAERVRGFGADPDAVLPSPDGDPTGGNGGTNGNGGSGGTGGTGGTGSNGDTGGTDGTSGPDAEAGAGSETRCRRMALVSALLLAALVVIAGLHPTHDYSAEVAAIAALMIGLWYWGRLCRPSACRIIVAALVGFGLGALALAILLIAGARGSATVAVLAWGGFIACFALASAMGCFAPSRKRS